MTDARVNVIYTSVACNKTANILDWGNDNIVCYGACNSIILWNPKEHQISQVLVGHTDRINCVRWVNSTLVSASTDGTAIIWVSKNQKYQALATLDVKNSVTLVDGIYVNGTLLVVTASIDSGIKVWMEKDEKFTVIQELKFKVGMAIALKLHKIQIGDVDIPILACSTTTCIINMYAGVQENGLWKFEFLDGLVGHEGWIYGLDMTIDQSGDLLLASASKDTYIRLWKLGINEKPPEDDIQMSRKVIQLEIKPGVIFALSIILESVLAGHEGWIYNVHWHPKETKLLSTSMDKTIILWTPDTESGVWLDSVRVGEVGGNTLGFYGGKFGPDGNTFIGHGYQGSLHYWNYESDLWKPEIVTGGHFNEVMDIGWEPQGEFLLSVSTDQTTRLHAPWVHNLKKSWHEIARPQVHGYDMSCIAVLSRYRFASGAEEKIIRVFEAPYNFVENFRNICKIENDTDGDKINFGNLPKGASVPSLGLSNKAVFESEIKSFAESNTKEEYPDTSYFMELKLTCPPTEENLIQNTLWPEIQKLYGHGFELFAMASTSDGQILASVCKATKTEYAAILLWDTNQWKQTQQLYSHSLTVTQLKFSSDNQYLLSVSRDRRWSLFQKKEQFELIACTDKKTCLHARIIWCCSWSPDSKYFVTGSRDGKVIIWNLDQILGNQLLGNILDLKKESITAVDIAPKKTVNGEYLVAVGFETGKISLYCWLSKWREVLNLSNEDAHHKTVKKLAFRPLNDLMEDDVLCLASCGSDHIVRIYQISIKDL